MPQALDAVLGIVLIVYSRGVSLARVRLHIRQRHERWAGALSRRRDRLITGMTGSSVVPGVLLPAIARPAARRTRPGDGDAFRRLRLDAGTVARPDRDRDAETLLVSTAALVPALIGMELGKRLAKRLSEPLFRRVLLCAMMLLGLYIIARAL